MPIKKNLSLISIGKSKGIRLSKTLIEKYYIQDTIELIFEEDYIILKPKTSARAGWERAFKKMHEKGDDKIIMEDIFEDETFEDC
jgi:antitoxin MazE